MSPPNEYDIAKRFGLAQLDYQSLEHADPSSALIKSEALVGVEEGLSAICESLRVEEKGLGSCWREQPTQPHLPLIKVKVWGLRKPAEEGNYAPACGTINLFGTLSSLFHEMAHAIDFQHGENGTPWSHSELWISALNEAPQFCGQLLESVINRRRVRLSDIYLAAPHEFFARAFECFIVEREGGAWPHKPDCSCSKTYPQGFEREQLISVIEGNVATLLQVPTKSM